MRFGILSHLLAFFVSAAIAVAVIAVNWVIYDFWSRSVMYFPDRWMQVFPKWYSELFDAAVYGSFLITAIVAGFVVGAAFGPRGLKAAFAACLFVSAGYWLLLLVSTYGLIHELRTFWLPMACLFSGVFGGLYLGALAKTANARTAAVVPGAA